MSKIKSENRIYFLLLCLFLAGILCICLSMIFGRIIDQTYSSVRDRLAEGEVKGDTSLKPDFDTYKVIDVVDGDTIKIDYKGKIETVRLIGIDTPESVHPQRDVECYAIEASNKLKDLVLDKYVIVDFDDTQDKVDKYGRLLVYVNLSQENGNLLFINQEMIRQGFAFEYTYSKPYKYQEEFKKAQKYAQDNKLGLWSQTTCGGKVR